MKNFIKFLTAPVILLALALRKQHSRFYRPGGVRQGRAAAFLLLLLTVALGASYTAARAQSNPTTQIGFILDGSGSINQANSQNWNTITTGLANALADPNCVPQDGSVEFTLTVFSSSSEVVINPTTIDDAGVANDLATTVRDLHYPEQATNIAQGLVDTANAMHDSPNFSPDLKQAVNLVTDGAPNLGSNLDTCPAVSQDDNQRWVDAPPHTECARDYLLNKLEMTEDQDELDAEFIGAQGPTSDWLKDNIAYPQPGSYADLASNTFNDGWVLVVPDAEGFKNAVCTKFQQIIEPEETPEPPPTTKPPCNTCGDVHIKSPDGLVYNFQEVGDFILTQSTSGDMVLQARQGSLVNIPDVSVNTAAAMFVAGDTLEFYVKPQRRFYINDELTDLPSSNLQLTQGGIVVNNPTGDPSKQDFTIFWPDGNSAVRVVLFLNSHINISVVRLNGSLTYEGLLGNLDKNAQNDIQIRGGDVITPLANPEELKRFGDSWRPSAEESLFRDATPVSEAGASEDPLTLDDLDPDERGEALQTCQDAGITNELALGHCTYDVAVTNDEIFVDSAKAFQEDFNELPPAEQVLEPGTPEAQELLDNGVVTENTDEVTEELPWWQKILDQLRNDPAGLLSNPIVLGALGALVVLFILRLLRRRR